MKSPMVVDAARIDASQPCDPRLLAEWDALEARAAEPNAYLSRHFVLPALRHLLPGKTCRAALVRRRIDGRLVGMALSLPRGPSLRWPLGRLESFTTLHSYLSGWLVDQSCLREASRALVQAWCTGSFMLSVWVWPEVVIDGRLATSLLEAAESAGCWAWIDGVRERARLQPSRAGQSMLAGHAGGRRLKDWQRQRRRLAEHGRVTWRLVPPGADPATVSAAADRFLQLEDMGWRGKGGTSLRADPCQAAFYREMAAGFGGAGRLFLAETLVDGVVVASTFNMVAGDEGFAFKIGWDTTYARQGLGMLNELSMVEAAPEQLSMISRIDSGTQPGSFIEQLWPERVRVGTLVIARPGLSGLLARASWWLRRKIRGSRASM